MLTRRDSPITLLTVADALRDAEATGMPVAPPSSVRALTLDDAYAVQRINIDRRIADGERVVGRKVGLTSLAMQRQLGVDQPDFGVITDAMLLPDGGALDPRELIAARAEAEFAFHIGHDLPVSPSAAELREAIDGISLSIEIIDSRVVDWRITLVDTVADNASCARVVHGDVVRATAAALTGLSQAWIELRVNGRSAAAGPGWAVLGDPLRALEWLGGAIGAFGERFRAGDVVLAGAVAAAVPFQPGDTLEVVSSGMPTASLSIANDGPY